MAIIEEGTERDGGEGGRDEKSSRRGEDAEVGEGAGGASVAIPIICYCPISHVLMADPVIAADGYSYERSAIEAWFREVLALGLHPTPNPPPPTPRHEPLNRKL